MAISNIVQEIADVSSGNPIVGVIFAILAAIGLFKSTTVIISYFAVIFDVFFRAATDLSKYGAKKEAYAVITGASDGIGKEYAYQLAKKGFNLILVSRTESKLQALVEEVESKYKVSAKYVAIDIAEDSALNYSKLQTAIDSVDSIGVLVNNVGQSHSIPTAFVDTTDKELRDIITINNVATLKITQLVIPKISLSISNGKIKRGLVLNMGSFAGLTPTPLLATYSGSKAFLQGWNNALARELAPEKIDVQLVLSYLVTSAMSKIRKSSFSIPTPKRFVASALAQVGVHGGAQERYATSTPYPAHALMHWWIENTLGVWSKVVIGFNYSMHVSIRKRALRRAERLAKEK